MIVFIAENNEQYYALEELHDFIGIIVHDTIYFTVENTHYEPLLKNEQKSVHFKSPQLIHTIPSIVETYIKQNNLYIETDILGLILRELSRSEECGKETDIYGRMPLERSLSYKLGLHQIAYLDRVIALFRTNLINYLESQGVQWEQIRPFQKPTICITHDVDSVKGKSILRYAYIIAHAVSSMNRSVIKNDINRLISLINANHDPIYSFDDILSIEKTYGFKSSFFMLSLPFFLGREGRRYTLENKKVKQAMSMIMKEGWEIGIHPSRITRISKEMLNKEMKRLTVHIGGNVIQGARNHYLCASFPETWRIQEELCLLYDSSLGWAESPGFRAGTAKPFRPFDIEYRRKLNIWELPLIVMDGTLRGSMDEIVDSCIDLSTEAFRNYNPFTFLWHTDRIINFEYAEFSSAYLKLMKYFQKIDCVGLTARDIIITYKEYNKKMSKQRKKIRDI